MQAFRHPSHAPSPSGFSLVELIVVIVVLGILGAVATTRYFSRSTFDVTAYTSQVRGLIRYGQKVAVAQGRPVYVRIAPAGVALCFTADCSGARVPAPSGANSASSVTVTHCEGSASWACEGVPSSLALTRVGGVAGTSLTFWYDALGKPFAEGDVSTATTSTFAALDLLVTGADRVEHVLIEAETGYVH